MWITKAVDHEGRSHCGNGDHMNGDRVVSGNDAAAPAMDPSKAEADPLARWAAAHARTVGRTGVPVGGDGVDSAATAVRRLGPPVVSAVWWSTRVVQAAPAVKKPARDQPVQRLEPAGGKTAADRPHRHGLVGGVGAPRRRHPPPRHRQRR
jgi:hypothetical protein